MAIYTINRLPSSNIDNKSLFHILIKRMSDYKYLRTFGTHFFPLLPKTKRDKFSPKAEKCCFFGYSPNHRGYR